MAGQIIRRGDRTWVVRIFQGRDDTGKRRYINKTIHGTKKEAEIDLEKGSATVRRAIVWNREKGGGWQFAEPKTVGPLNDSAHTRHLLSRITRHATGRG